MGRKINIEFQKGLEKKKLVYFPKAKKLVRKELQSASGDLHEAVDRFKNGKFKYATITAYYSMFHTARAFIYSKGYREKSHYYLLVALQSLFVEKGILEEKLVTEFHDAMILREDADYHGEFSKEGAESVIGSAKQFTQKARLILK